LINKRSTLTSLVKKTNLVNAMRKGVLTPSTKTMFGLPVHTKLKNKKNI